MIDDPNTVSTIANTASALAENPGTLSAVFNSAATTAGIGLAVGGLMWWKFVKMLKPDTQKAYIVTGHKFPQFSLKKDQFVVRNAPQRYFTPWSSKPEEVNLNSFAVQIDRTAADRSALTLKDYVKAEVEVVFFVRVDKTKDENIIQAKQSLGEINEKTIKSFLEAKFDSALRDAAATMTLEEVQSDREKFLDTVKGTLKLEPFGLELTDVALRRLNQAPKEVFNENDSFDAQGLKKVTQIIEESKKIRNDTVQQNATQISERNKEETLKRLLISQQQREAELNQEQEVKRLEAEQGKKVSEIQAENSKMAKMAAIKADEETEKRRIEKERQIGISEQDKAKQIAIAQADQERETELAARNKQIALFGKDKERAAAEKAANEAKADAIKAEQEVITVRQTAEAERNKRLAVIEAEQRAGQEQAAEKIEADTKVYVAQKGAEAAKMEAEGMANALKIEAEAHAEAETRRAAGTYQTTFQQKKAEADGDVLKAEAQRKLNEAQNAMSDEVREYLVQLRRADITPQVVEKLTASIAKIGSFNVVSMDGVPYPGGGAPGAAANGGGAASGSVIDQAYSAMLRYGFDKQVIGQVVSALGGDPKVTAFLPDMKPAAAAPVAAAPAPAAETSVTPPFTAAVTKADTVSIPAAANAPAAETPRKVKVAATATGGNTPPPAAPTPGGPA